MAQKTKQPRAVLRHQCGSCNEIFTGKTCPNCGEEINIFRVNADGVPIDEIANAVGATHSLPITLQASPGPFDAASAMEAQRQQQFQDVIQDAELDKAKMRAAEAAAKRMRAEKELEATEKGFLPPGEGGQQQEEQSGFASMSPGIFLQALGGWDPEQREQFLNQLASNPMLALNLSMMMNPGKAGNMNQMGGMMNPMAMMGQMMQPPVEQAPQANATEMVTAMIAGMSALKEMSGGDGGNNQQMERMLDEMKEMRKETEDMKLKLVEAQSKPSESLTSEDIRRIVVESMTGATSGKMGLLNGLQEIHAVADELTDLGIVQKPHAETDPAQALEERKFTHQMKMDEKREQRDHELNLKVEEAEAAKANAKEAFIAGLFTGANDNQTADIDEDEKDDQTVPMCKVEPRQTAVIS